MVIYQSRDKETEILVCAEPPSVLVIQDMQPVSRTYCLDMNHAEYLGATIARQMNARYVRDTDEEMTKLSEHPSLERQAGVSDESVLFWVCVIVAIGIIWYL